MFFLDNTACNLASLNLRNFFDVNTLKFDVEGFENAARIWTVVLEISVLMAQFPSKEVAKLSYDYRTLGLGFANLGSVLMVSGIPYDSSVARAIGGAITAIMTGTAYKTSAEMAEFIGPFNGYKKNSKHMMKVMHNHRYAAYNAEDAYEDLETKPLGIDPQHCPDYLLKSATKAWDDAVQLGEKHGYRNAQATVIAPTGTIGLVMDCDTTGVEPDFALVKFKKLSGGGYFKIINQSIPHALKNLGYEFPQIHAIVDYVCGTGNFKNAPRINHENLKQKGFSDDDLQNLDQAAVSAFQINFAFNGYTLGEECMDRLGIPADTWQAECFCLLHHLGFSEEDIQLANNHVCGTSMIEGAPYLKKEHLPVFDCANKCGVSGERFIAATGHIRMMGAVQPFVSGAISKTINLPHEATVEEIQQCYELSWKLGLKANALYRDGCKLSQPLSNKADTKKNQDSEKEETPAISATNGKANAEEQFSKLTPEQVLQAARVLMQESKDTTFKRALSKIVERKKLPHKRKGFTQKVKIGQQTVFVRTGEYKDGTLGEIFIDMHKEGASFRSILNCFAISVSIGLQYGVPLEEFVSKFTFSRFEPSGGVDHPNIKHATSVVDYIFRLLGFEYLNRIDLVHVTPEELDSNSQSPRDIDSETTGVEGETIMTMISAAVNVKNSNGAATQSEANTQGFLSSMMGDAPPCDNCGHITIRNGTCYKCLNCGSSLGCS